MSSLISGSCAAYGIGTHSVTFERRPPGSKLSLESQESESDDDESESESEEDEPEEDDSLGEGAPRATGGGALPLSGDAADAADGFFGLATAAPSRIKPSPPKALNSESLASSSCNASAALGTAAAECSMARLSRISLKLEFMGKTLCF